MSEMFQNNVKHRLERRKFSNPKYFVYKRKLNEMLNLLSL